MRTLGTPRSRWSAPERAQRTRPFAPWRRCESSRYHLASLQAIRSRHPAGRGEARNADRWSLGVQMVRSSRSSSSAESGAFVAAGPFEGDEASEGGGLATTTCHAGRPCRNANPSMIQLAFFLSTQPNFDRMERKEQQPNRLPLSRVIQRGGGIVDPDHARLEEKKAHNGVRHGLGGKVIYGATSLETASRTPDCGRTFAQLRPR